MDMQIDASRIRGERERRAWSQEHLGAVSGLSLRTVQRVEASGTASFETARALAAVFELPVEQLKSARAAAAPRSAWARLRYLAAAALLAAGLSLFFVRAAHAGDVALDVSVALDDAKLGQHQLVAPEGKSAEIKLEGEIRLFINPIVTKEGTILLSMRVEGPAGSGWKEFAEPRVLVANGDEATVKVTSPKGSNYWIAVRPKRL
jgi:transcriptional regulator with XRE-family HTH domain